MDPTTGLHVPTPISPKDFERGHLAPFSYTQEAISAAIVANTNRGFKTTLRNLSIRQTHAYNRFLYTGFWSISQPGHLDNLKRFFDIFDDAYFGGHLKGYCTLELVEERTLSCLRNLKGIDGICQPHGPGLERDPRFKLEQPRVNIVITNYFRDDERRLKWTIDQIPNYLGTLAHEMLHAFFLIYTCGCIDCSEGRDDLSGGSHGEFWQAAACAIEKVDRRQFLGLELDFSRTFNLAVDIQSGFNMPNAATLRSLNINITELWEKIRNLRAQVASQEEEESAARRLQTPLKANSCTLYHRRGAKVDHNKPIGGHPTLFEPLLE
jgi:hypothetical protein